MAMLALARPDAADADRRGGDRACPDAERDAASRVAASTSSASAAPGLSAYANIARALGRRGARLGRPRDDLHGDARRGRDRPRRRADRRPHGWEVVVSTAHTGTGSTALPRAEFLAELVAARPSIVVGGAHGKTTTAAMIAFVLRETGRDPAWIIGGVVPQLGGNAGAGAGWLVVEGDESDRSIGSLATADRRAHQHRARPPRHLRLRGRAARVPRRVGFAAVPHVVRSWELEPVAFELAVAGEHNRQNAAAALAALELAGVPREPRRSRRSSRFTGRRPAVPARRGARRGRGLRRLRPQPDRARGDAAHGPRARRRAR